MSITTALEALEASLTQPGTTNAVVDALVQERSMISAAEHWMTQAIRQAAAEDHQLARQSIAKARSCLTRALPR